MGGGDAHSHIKYGCEDVYDVRQVGSMQMPFSWPAAGLGGSTRSLLCSVATPSGELPSRLTSFDRRRYVFAEHGLSLQEYLVAPPHGYFDKASAPFPNPK